MNVLLVLLLLVDFSPGQVLDIDGVFCSTEQDSLILADSMARGDDIFPPTRCYRSMDTVMLGNSIYEFDRDGKTWTVTKVMSLTEKRELYLIADFAYRVGA